MQISPFVDFILLLAWWIRKGSGVVPIAMKTTNPPFWIVHMIYALTLLSICSYIAKRENQLLWPYLTLLCNWWWCIGKKYQQFGRIGYICYVLCISQKARSFNSIHCFSFLYQLKYSEHFISYQYMLANAVSVELNRSTTMYYQTRTYIRYLSIILLDCDMWYIIVHKYTSTLPSSMNN